MKNISTFINESKEDYKVYHETYTSAIETALDYAKSKGYTYSDEDAGMEIGIKSSRPKNGTTEKISLPLYKGEKLQKKALQIQVADLGNKYELNCYIF